MKLSEVTMVLFDRVLAEYNGAIIAGGAVRDALIGFPINDIDVWVGLDDRPLIRTEPVADPDYDAANGRFVVARVTENYDWCPHPIHVMLVSGGGLRDDPDRILDGFDYGLCKVAYTPDGLHLTPDFLIDERNRQASLVSKGHTSQERYSKLREKLVGWNVEVPAELL